MKFIRSIREISEVDTVNFTAVFIFDDNKVKWFDFKNLQNDKYKKIILTAEVFGSMVSEADGILFKHPKLKDHFGYYGIGGDTLYRYGKEMGQT